MEQFYPMAADAGWQNKLGAGGGYDLRSFSDIMELLRNRQIDLSQRESRNVVDDRNFANEHWLIRGNAELASGISGLVAGLQYLSNKSAPPVSMKEISDLLPADDRLARFAAPALGSR